jgi:tetratricopeptide (TPR) repeat protein
MSTESSDRTLILDSTTVDLGDDLLKTRTTMAPPSEQSEITAETERKDPVLDWIESAKILMSEGIFGEAKKNLRKVLVFDPLNVIAPKLLEQIQDIEVQRLLQDEQTSVFQRKRAGDDVREPHEVLDQLVSDLKLEIEDDDESAFAHPEAEQAFFGWVSGFKKGASPKDLIDFGVALIQMQLYALAVEQFTEVENDATLDDDSPHYQQAKSLKAYALILSGRGFEALLQLDRLIENNLVKTEDKIDWAYLNGRAHEELRNWEKSVYWYAAVLEIDPTYRDTVERTRRCEKILSSSSS